MFVFILLEELKKKMGTKRRKKPSFIYFIIVIFSIDFPWTNQDEMRSGFSFYEFIRMFFSNSFYYLTVKKHPRTKRVNKR